MLDFTFQDELQTSPFDRAHFERIIWIALRYLELHEYTVGISLRMVSEDEMRELNKTYRNKDVPTDVLSFPIYDGLVDSKMPIHDILELGDLVICMSVASEKAKAHGKSLEDEVSFLVVHGLLHLLGYDHERSAEEEERMFAIQDKILALL